MPVFSRKTLRQNLGIHFLYDTVLGNNETSVGAAATAQVFDSFWIDWSASGQGLYQNAWIRAGGVDYRVASYNVASGNFLFNRLVPSGQSIPSGQFEIHTRLNAEYKDHAIDDTLVRLRVRQEVGITTHTDNLTFYAIDGAASPYAIADVLNVYYFAAPDGTLTRQQNYLNDARIVTTATGRELRINPGLLGSQQLILDAILTLTLTAGDDATINIPDDRWLLAGAAAKAYSFIIQQAPGQQAGELRNRQMEWAAEFTRLSSRFAPNYERKIRLEIA